MFQISLSSDISNYRDVLEGLICAHHTLFKRTALSEMYYGDSLRNLRQHNLHEGYTTHTQDQVLQFLTRKNFLDGSMVVP